MKKNIHPNYDKSKVECICGNSWETRSTVSSIKIELCSVCHPFFTGKQKLVDTAGRVDKFKARMEAAQAKSAENVSKKDKEAARVAKKQEKKDPQ